MPWVAAYALSLAFVVALDPEAAALSGQAITSLEAGSVAASDVIAERDVVWVDEEATKARREAVARLVLPIFVVDENAVNRAMEAFRSFKDEFLGLLKAKVPPEEFPLRMQGLFVDAVSDAAIVKAAKSIRADRIFTVADLALSGVLSEGVAAIPQGALERYNPDYLELRSWDSDKLRYERVPISRAVTAANAAAALLEKAKLQGGADVELAVELAAGFVVPTAFFDAQGSEERLAQQQRDVVPVLRRIAKGEMIVRKGLVVTTADVERVRGAYASGLGVDVWSFAGDALSLAFVLALGLILFSAAGSSPSRRDQLILLCACTAYAIGIAAAAYFNPTPEALPSTVFVPAALLTMLAAALYGQRAALSLAVTMAAISFAVTRGDPLSTSFAALTGAAGAVVIRGAGTRIDLVRAGAELAGLSALASLAASALGRLGLIQVAQAAAWSALHGFTCALLSLALLPLIEQALNAPTVFRLIELSDLNAPAMRRLLTSAPGTYSHSVNVAHLAESACRAIGANALLARVGAYYHDLGKTEQPEYFVENQAGYNRHDDLNPRLSATVIRSHVKLGIEKTKALKLPDRVVDIVGQHHGNAVIKYFYDRALKLDPEARADDFAYPGQIPTSKEAAVVMIADAAEAATRAMKNPTLARIDQTLRDIVNDRLEEGQLDACDITMQELATVRETIARILTGSFHLRIEYPERDQEPEIETSPADDTPKPKRAKGARDGYGEGRQDAARRKDAE